MLLESDQYDQTLNVIYETLTHSCTWHAVCTAIAGLIGARVVYITVDNKRLVNRDSESIGNGQNTIYYKTSVIQTADLPIGPIESFARFESQLKIADSAHINSSAYVSSRSILDTGDFLITLACEFASESEALARSESRWLDRLMPHLSRAAHLQDAGYFAPPSSFTRGPFLNDSRQPAMLVALNGTVLRLNDATMQMLGRTSLVRIVDGLLELHGEAQRRILEECLASADGTPGHRMLRLTGELRGDPAVHDTLYLFYRAIAVSHGHAALLTFYHPESPPIVDPDLLASAFDLTPAECRVACHIAQGRTTKEIASQIGVQHDTVRKQLQAIYQKTATNRQVDLIRLLLNLPVHSAPD